MKQIILLATTVFLFSSVKAQDSVFNSWEFNKKDPFNDVHCPIPDGYSMWMMRQNMIVKGFQTVLETNSIFDKKFTATSPEYRVETYLPLFEENKVNSLIGARYWKTTLLEPEIPIDKTIQFVWLWTTLQYKPGEKWNFILSAEMYQKGNTETFLRKTGNYFFSILYCGYSLGSKWQLIGFGGIEQNQKESGKELKPVMALQLKFLPSESLKIMTGMPVIIASEWTANKKLDFAGYVWYNMKNSFFIRYRMTDKTGLSIIYNGTDLKSTNLYTDNRSFSYQNQNYTYDNISQLQHRLNLELGMKFTRNTSIQLRAGYIFKTSTRFNLDDQSQYYSQKGSGWITGISVYFLNFD